MLTRVTIYALVLLSALHAACAQQGSPPSGDGATLDSATAEHRDAPPGGPDSTAGHPEPGAAGATGAGTAAHAPQARGYRFDRPDASYTLPDELEEISGLAVLDEGTLGAIQDEDGVLFLVDIRTGQVKARKKFGKDGDYEGIERAGDRLFVIRSDGTLYEIEDWQAAELRTKTIKTGLSERYDTEGLAYDAAQNRLLIACKEYAGKGLKDQKAIYAFDLARRRLVEAPAFTIDIDAFNRKVEEEREINRHIRSLLEPVMDLSGFKPSGLALHPVTGDLYVLSSVRKAIVVLEAAGQIRAAYSLSEDLFAQPEGIAFLPNGDLFIASEGGGRGAGMLLRFNYR